MLHKIESLLLQNREAQLNLGKSVLEVSETALFEALDLIKKDTNPLFMGVKNTNQMEQAWIDKLKQQFVYHTLDSMAKNGRAIDPLLENPLTLRRMTGSSSGTALNVLYGINDLGLGTDGGGSVLYPAMTLNLYSVILAGLGFIGKDTKESTDNISFQASLGLISFHKESLGIGLKLLTSCTPNTNNVKMAGDQYSLESLDILGDQIICPNTDNREELIGFLQEQFINYEILIFHESRIDSEYYGDSVLGTTSSFYRNEQQRSNKKIGKVVNMIGASAFTIPSREASSGYIIVAKKGEEAFCKAWALFQTIQEQRTELFLSYFQKFTAFYKNFK